jgi:hypothetical protein
MSVARGLAGADHVSDHDGIGMKELAGSVVIKSLMNQ